MEIKTKLLLPCVRGMIGDWIYYSTFMSARQITEWVQSAKEIREAKSLDDQLQRSLRERDEAIASYLYTRENRFFNSIVIGVYGGLPDWNEFLIEEKVGELGGTPKEFESTMGIMEFLGSEKMFAIDGQHRVAGIQFSFKESEKIKNKTQIIESDRYPVILIAHIDDESGRKRTRQLFSDINRKAKGVPKKDQIIIDEETLTHIVTRQVYANYEYFKGGALIDHLHENTNLQANDEEHFTNLTNLNTVITILKRLYKKENGSNEWDDLNVQSLKAIVFEFFDIVIKLIPEFNSFFIENSVELKTLRNENRYLLFRPVGLTLLAKIYSYYYKNGRLSEFKKKIIKVSFVAPDTFLDKVLWSNGKMEAKGGNQTLAYDLSLYVLGNEITDLEKLTKRYREITKNDKAELPEIIK